MKGPLDEEERFRIPRSVLHDLLMQVGTIGVGAVVGIDLDLDMDMDMDMDMDLKTFEQSTIKVERARA
ncbi:hypothetical protein J7T55_003586 [Diaporthe amygdali]|uniref:uncharacterized protein n=1 Tax=Phomopsis amygdali TaxID=1214568 RepID=UPI0022FDC47A|nr:uncharacterized protein J7T55_003586 [Diaporthe amygdali]KAJ0117169.1 hypothetical protein J7T55_003586 [Diaporthe amygdali]